MEGSASQKVPGGKMLIVKVNFEQKINAVQITGDFFLYPEDSLDKIEGALIGLDINDSLEKIRGRVDDVVKKNRIEMIGINPEAIAQTIKMAVKR